MNNSPQPPTLPPINLTTTTSSSTNETTTTNNNAANNNNNANGGVQLCASCDRCRSRKTKCDGARPCLNCKNRYLRLHKNLLTMEDLSKMDNIADMTEFDCIYSPAKRRGPVPGTKSGQSRSNKSQQSSQQQQGGGVGKVVPQQQQQQLVGGNLIGGGYTLNTSGGGGVSNNLGGGGGGEGGMVTSGFDHHSMNHHHLPNNAAVGSGGFASGGGMNNITSGGGGTNTTNEGGMDLNVLLNQLNQQQGGGAHNNNNNNNNNNSGGNSTTDQTMKQMILLQQQLMLQQQQIQQQQQFAQQMGQLSVQQQQQQVGGVSGVAGGGGGGMIGVNTLGGGGDPSLQLLQQYQNQQQVQQVQQVPSLQQQQMNHNPMAVLSGQHQLQPQQQQQQQRGSFYDESTTNTNSYQQQQQQQDELTRSAKRSASTPQQSNNNTPSTIVSTHLPLLNPHNPSGTLLRQYFELSTNNVLNLPPIPTNEEYCTILLQQQQQQQQQRGMYNTTTGHVTPETLPMYDQSALNAARFSQLALGALSNDQVGLALELSNACVMCLKNCVEEPSHKSCLSTIARAYLLHGIFRSLRGDFTRYFKYRRVCMTQIFMLEEEEGRGGGQGQDREVVDALLAAISFHDAWAYMMYNAVEDELPDIDTVVPRVGNDATTDSNSNWGCGRQMVTDPVNQMWIQGEPRIFLKNEARIVDRSLDAISCAVRSCCDQANREFAQMSQAMGGGGGGGGGGMCEMTTPTSLAVMASENELCSRNMVLSAQALVNQNNAKERVTKPGLNMMITAMDAFLENSDAGDSGGGGGAQEGGFSETQIRNLLSACEMAIKHPLLLHSPGPVYHMMSNAAVLLCHLLNGLHAKCSLRESSPESNSDEGGAGGGNSNDNMESELFYNTLDTFMSIRKLLNMHRQNLPVRLRCHAIPRPNIGPSKKTDPETPFIDLGETLMCSCRGCQGFVLMGCSPCVAAERSLRSARNQEILLEDDEEFKREIDDLGDFNLDDDALFSILSRVANS